MAKTDEKKDEKKSGSGRLIQYAGFSDERSISKNDNFGGRLPEGFGVDAVWNEANNHLVELDLDPEVLDLLLTSQIERDGTGDFFPAFRDVTGMKVIPPNGWAQRWRPQGHTDARQVSAMVGDASGLAAVTSTSSGAYGPGSTGGSGTGSDTTT